MLCYVVLRIHFSDINIEVRARGRMGQVDFLFLALVVAVFVVTGHIVSIFGTYPCQSVSGSVIDSFKLEVAIASPSFASLFSGST